MLAEPHATRNVEIRRAHKEVRTQLTEN